MAQSVSKDQITQSDYDNYVTFQQEGTLPLSNELEEEVKKQASNEFHNRLELVEKLLKEEGKTDDEIKELMEKLAEKFDQGKIYLVSLDK